MYSRHLFSILQAFHYIYMYLTPPYKILHETKSEDAEVKLFARAFSTLSVNDKKEIINLIDFKMKFKELMI